MQYRPYLSIQQALWFDLPQYPYRYNLLQVHLFFVLKVLKGNQAVLCYISTKAGARNSYNANYIILTICTFQLFLTPFSTQSRPLCNFTFPILLLFEFHFVNSFNQAGFFIIYFFPSAFYLFNLNNQFRMFIICYLI